MFSDQQIDRAYFQWQQNNPKQITEYLIKDWHTFTQLVELIGNRDQVEKELRVWQGSPLFKKDLKKGYKISLNTK